MWPLQITVDCFGRIPSKLLGVMSEHHFITIPAAYTGILSITGTKTRTFKVGPISKAQKVLKILKGGPFGLFETRLLQNKIGDALETLKNFEKV